MPGSVLIDGRRRSAITLPGYRLGMKPANFGQKYPAEVLSRQEVGELLAACSRRGPTGLRNRALIVVMWRAGLRVAEALALYPKDVDLDAGTIAVLHGKGDRRRLAGMDAQAGAVVDAWLSRRRELGIGRGAPLFCAISVGSRGRPLRSAYVRETMKLLARKAGIEKRVHPHGLRHTCAAELALEGVPVHVIRRQLGHASLATTERYIDHLMPMDIVGAMQLRQWLSHESPPARSSPAPAASDLAGESDRVVAIGAPGAERRPRSRRASAAARSSTPASRHARGR
jgi:site-specific recombinase XerD